jgi:hypothetical protein
MNKIIFTLSIMLISWGAYAQSSEIFSTTKGAINGYDVVAFFKESKPIKGEDKLTFEWQKAVWHFATTENLEAFKANPEKYAPQYGGYCAYGTSDGHKAPTQADTWTIVSDKLYFNYNENVKVLWNKNQAELIKKADINWPKIKDLN